MKNRKALIISISILLAAIVWSAFFRGKPNNYGNSGSPEAKMFAAKALNVFGSLQAGDPERAAKDFLPGEMGPGVTPEQLGLQWTYIKQIWGSCKGYRITHAEECFEDRAIAYSVYVTCKFRKGKLYATVNFGPQKQITRFILSDKPQR